MVGRVHGRNSDIMPFYGTIFGLLMTGMALPLNTP